MSYDSKCYELAEAILEDYYRDEASEWKKNP